MSSLTIPLRFRDGKWFRAGNLTSEFMVEEDLSLDRSTALDFVSHYPRYCGLYGGACEDIRRSPSQQKSAARMLAHVLAQGHHGIDRLWKPPGVRPVFMPLETGYSGLWLDLANKKTDFGGALRRPESCGSAVMGALALHSLNQIDEARDLLSLIESGKARRAHQTGGSGRIASRAALEVIVVRRQQRCQQYLDMVVGWSRKHRRRKFPHTLRARFMGPRSARETEEQRRERWDRDVRAFLDKQYAKAPHYKASLLALWEKYLALKLPTEHFVTEFTSGKKAVVFQRAWEMMVARHLHAQGFAITVAAHGPDFRFEHAGRTFWIEAVSPEPKGVPEDYLEGPKPGEFKVGDVPHEEVRRRWIAAIKAKADKLAGYRAKGIVGGDDAYIIAVNGCQLGALPIHHGVLQLPYAVEAVYPAGPIAVPVDKKTGAFGKPYLSNQWAIKSGQGKPVPTSMFVNKKYADISGIIACTSDRSEEPILPLDVVHNHFAKVAVPLGLFGPKADEWVTEPDGKDGINVKKVEAKAGAVGRSGILGAP